MTFTKGNQMDILGNIFCELASSLRQAGDTRTASACDVIHSSMRLGDAIEQPRSQIKPALVTCAATGRFFAVLDSVVQARKNYYYA